MVGMNNDEIGDVCLSLKLVMAPLSGACNLPSLLICLDAPDGGLRKSTGP